MIAIVKRFLMHNKRFLYILSPYSIILKITQAYNQNYILINLKINLT